MNKRQENDYGDFLEFSEEEIKPLFQEVQTFPDTIRKLTEK